MQTQKISILAPVYNEAEVIDDFFGEIISVLEKLDEQWEIICVDDGSHDNTYGKLGQWHQRDERIKIIRLSRNFGKEIALTAALDFATGDALIPIDTDLQDPPECIPLMVEKWREGYEIVNAVRRVRYGESFIKKTTANLFYKYVNYISDIDIPRDTGDFRLISRKAGDILRTMREKRRFMKGMFSWVGFKSTSILYDRRPRNAGMTKWNYWRLWNFALEGITSFSTIPLRIATYLGFFISISTLFYTIYFIFHTLFFGNPVDGYPSLMTSVLFFGGVQLIFIGIIGEYIGRIYEEVKNRPIYVIENIEGISMDGKEWVESLGLPKK